MARCGHCGQEYDRHSSTAHNDTGYCSREGYCSRDCELQEEYIEDEDE